MDEAAGLTDQEREDRARKLELQRLASRDGQAQEFRDALMQALNATNLEIGSNGIQPRIDAVIAATSMIQAEFIAMYPNRGERRRIMAEIEANVSRMVALRLNTGTKTAKELNPEPEPGKPN